MPLIIIGTLPTMMNAWLSASAHNYQSELFPTRIRARAAAFVYILEPVQHDLRRIFMPPFGVPGMFLFIASAMAMVVLSILLLGSNTNRRALEEISP